MVRVIDGDTVVVDAHPWPDQSIRVAVRLRDVDAPELRSKCVSARISAEKAKQVLTALLIPGASVELRNVSGGKYYGRILADLSHGEENLGAMLIGKGLAVPYDGGKRREPACPNS